MSDNPWPRDVLVTTEYRGIFFGRLRDDDNYNRDARHIILHKVRNVIRLEGRRGFLGLAAHGPEDGSLVGSGAPRVELHGVTSVADCTGEAVAAFERIEVPS